MKISERIFEIMAEKGISQKGLAEASGIKQNVISDWNTKGTNPSSNKLMKIAAALEVDVKELLVSPEGELYD